MYDDEEGARGGGTAALPHLEDDEHDERDDEEEGAEPHENHLPGPPARLCLGVRGVGWLPSAGAGEVGCCASGWRRWGKPPRWPGSWGGPWGELE